MKLQTSVVRGSLFIFAAMLALPGFQASAQTTPDSAVAAQAAAISARITQAIDETQLVRLKGNVHPLARPEFDHGAVSDATPMKRMMLLLQRSSQQQAALRQFMDEQLSKDSPNFQKWLTPQQFGQQFGPADADVQAVTAWLSSHGFTAIRVAPGRNVIEFSGNVGQVRNAFHTEIHRFVVNGDERQANTSDPQIPAVLTPVIAGIVSLHNFPSRSMRRVVGQFTHTRVEGETTPQFTTAGGNFALGPADFAKIYNIPSTLDGTGGNIAIVGFSTINVNDAHSFRALFGLPVNDPVIVNNGPDPGFDSEEEEADLDVQWSGAVAPKATIHYVLSEGTLTSDPIFLSAEYVIDNNSDDVMSLSFGTCEAGLGATANAFFNTLWEQAAAQGITVTVSTGDSGSAGCDNFNIATAAASGLAVSGFASTPFNIAVGGTDFDDVGMQTSFWSTTNAAGTRESALGYIHEVPWNDSCAATATPTNLTTCATANNIVAGSGGPSAVYPKPSWQNGLTPADSHRDLPDVSLFASDGPQSMSSYVICQADAVSAGSPPSCVPDSSGNFTIFRLGGTSASAPSFAGIIALIGQSESNAGRSRRQGNANLVLYKIAATASNNCNSSTTPLTGSTTCAFYDVTKGNNSVPCTGASPGCSSTTAGTNGVLVTTSGSTKTPAFTAAAGYDMATGLGTVNVANLATVWGTAIGTFKGTTTTLKINGSSTPGTITHGTAVTAAVTVAVVSPATGTPTGDVAVLAPSGTVNGGGSDGTLSSGTVTLSGVILPGGTYNATAHYAGDGTFAPSDSAVVPITVNKESSRLQYGIVTFDPVTNAITSTNSTSFAYGSPYVLRFDILNSSTSACAPLATPAVLTGCARDATGTVTITDNGAPLNAGTFPVNSEGSGEDEPIQLNAGSHVFSATYSGDNSYNAVATPVTDSVMVSQAATQVASLTASPASGVTTATPVALTALMSSGSNSTVGLTGTVTFFSGGVQIGSPAAVTPIAAAVTAGAGGTATLTTTFTTAGTKTITAQYNGDTNYAASVVSSSIMVTVTQGQTGSFTVSGAAATVAAGGMGSSTITLTPTGGFTSTGVAITCGALPGVTCSALSIPVPNANAAMGTLTVNLTAPSSSMTAMATPAAQDLWATSVPLNRRSGKGWWMLSAGTGLAGFVLLLLPGRKRYRAAMGLGLICMVSFAIGCSSSTSSGGGGPVATTTHFTVSTTKLKTTDTLTVSATVTGGTPAASVQFFVDGAAAGTAVPVTGGTTGNIMLTAASAPPLFQLIGTHTLSAHYLGDANTLASASGTLNVTVTGSTQLVITANPASSNANPTISLTIN
jgi:subtilase family serine protease